MLVFGAILFLVVVVISIPFQVAPNAAHRSSARGFLPTALGTPSAAGSPVGPVGRAFHMFPMKFHITVREGKKGQKSDKSLNLRNLFGSRLETVTKSSPS